MSGYIWIGKDLSETNFHREGQGTAYRPLNADGTRNKSAPYLPFDSAMKDIHRAARRGIRPVKPRLSRKGNPVSGILPRLCGY